MIRTLTQLYCILILLFNHHIVANEKHEKVSQYIDTLVTETKKLLNNHTLTPDQRIGQSRELIAKNLDLNWMAMYSLGRYRKDIDPAQIKIFIDVYSEYVVKLYSDLTKNYKGEKTQIDGMQPIGSNEFIVKTQIVKQDGQLPVKVDYLIRELQIDSATPHFKIFDIITEGVSMINAQAAEFSSILLNQNISALTEILKSKLLQ